MEVVNFFLNNLWIIVEDIFSEKINIPSFFKHLVIWLKEISRVFFGSKLVFIPPKTLLKQTKSKKSVYGIFRLSTFLYFKNSDKLYFS